MRELWQSGDVFVVDLMEASSVPNHQHFPDVRVATPFGRRRQHLFRVPTPGEAKALHQAETTNLQVHCRREAGGGEPIRISLKRAQARHFRQGMPPCNECLHRFSCAGE